MFYSWGYEKELLYVRYLFWNVACILLQFKLVVITIFYQGNGNRVFIWKVQLWEGFTYMFNKLDQSDRYYNQIALICSCTFKFVSVSGFQPYENVKIGSGKQIEKGNLALLKNQTAVFAKSHNTPYLEPGNDKAMS